MRNSARGGEVFQLLPPAFLANDHYCLQLRPAYRHCSGRGILKQLDSSNLAGRLLSPLYYPLAFA